MNRYEILGHLGKDPEIKHLEGDKTVAVFSVATTRRHKTKEGEKIEYTEWHNVVMWNALARIAEKYLRKSKGWELNKDSGYVFKDGALLPKGETATGRGRRSKPKPEVETQEEPQPEEKPDQ